MSTNKCVICDTKFEAVRGSKRCCSKECKDIYTSDYNRDRYLEFRNANRKKRREMLVEKYSITSSNLYKFAAICDGCLLQFYYDYSIFEKFNDTYVSHFNTTEWGVGVCPNCGLVCESIYDNIAPDIHQIGDAELKTYLYNLRKNKHIVPKRQAIYLKGGQLDFIAEAEFIRKQVNRIKNKGELTQEEINECIAKLMRMSQ